MTRKISAQGDFDGACFLYSIANAVAALTGSQLSAAQWKKSIKTLPFRVDDFLTCLGTDSLNGRQIYFDEISRHFCEQSKDNSFAVSSKDGIKTATSLRNTITEGSVAIVALHEGAHWVCVVDADASHFYISCSAEALRAGTTYMEARSPNLGRVFNRKSKFAEMNIWKKYALVIQCVDI